MNDSQAQAQELATSQPRNSVSLGATNLRPVSSDLNPVILKLHVYRNVCINSEKLSFLG